LYKEVFDALELLNLDIINGDRGLFVDRFCRLSVRGVEVHGVQYFASDCSGEADRSPGSSHA